MRIGLVGKMHAGKGAVATRLVEAHGFRQLAFADPVKDASVAAINAALACIGQDQWMTRAILERDKAALRLMPQFIGTDLGRQYLGDPDLWIKLLLDRVTDPRVSPEHSIVVDDCRFPNEAAALRAAGFQIVLVERDELARRKSIVAALLAANPGLPAGTITARLDESLDHPSESGVDRIIPDTVLHNAGTIDELHQAIDRLVTGGA